MVHPNCARYSTIDLSMDLAVHRPWRLPDMTSCLIKINDFLSLMWKESIETMTNTARRWLLQNSYTGIINSGMCTILRGKLHTWIGPAQSESLLELMTIGKLQPLHPRLITHRRLKKVSKEQHGRPQNQSILVHLKLDRARMDHWLRPFPVSEHTCYYVAASWPLGHEKW